MFQFSLYFLLVSVRLALVDLGLVSVSESPVLAAESSSEPAPLSPVTA